MLENRIVSVSNPMKHLLRRAASVPLHAYPRVLFYRLRRAWVSFTAPDRPHQLNDHDLLSAFNNGSSISELLTEFQNREPLSLFFGDDPMQRASQVALASPGLESRLRSQADAIMDHRFDLLGSGLTDLGSKIPWRSDFISKHKWPLEHSSRLTIVDLDAGFDVKVPWELSRFHHATTLGQCYSLTGNEKYAQEFVAQLTDWWSENPAGLGPNWGNAMEAAIRSMNWIIGYELLRRSPALDDKFTTSFLKSLLQHGRYITKNLESGWPGSNHLIADLCGLVVLGVFLSPARESRLWLSKGLRLLRRELKAQILPDGADYEGSSSYHLLVAEMVLWTVVYCGLHRVAVPPIIRERLSDMLDVVSGLLRPDGNLPLFGDCDSGRWLVLESDRSSLATLQDPRGVLALAAVLFDRTDWAALAESPSPRSGMSSGGGCRWEAALWTFGHRAATLRASIQTSPAKPQTSIVFPDAGWYVMRRGEHYLAITAGGNGTAGWGGHSHNDALSFELAIGERIFLVDPGSYTYTGDYQARNAFRSTAAHNTMRVDGQEMNRIPERDMFRLENDARVGDLVWRDDEELICLEARCVYSSGPRSSYSHRRRFEYDAKLECWLLDDAIFARQRSAHGCCEIFFHFAALPLVIDGLTVSTVCPSGPNLALLPTKEATASLSVSLERGWISHRYGVRVEAPIVRYSFLNSEVSGARFVLVPFSGHADLDNARITLHQVQ